MFNSLLWTIYDEGLLNYKIIGDSFGENFTLSTDLFIFTFPYLYYHYGAGRVMNLQISAYDAPTVTFLNNDVWPIIRLDIPIELRFSVIPESRIEEEVLVIDLDF